MNDPTYYHTGPDGTVYADNMGGSGQNYYYDRSNSDASKWGWQLVAATPSVATSTAPSVQAPPHLQFSASTVGSPVFLMHGRCKLAGQIIWALGIDATNDALDTSFLTFAAAYGEPLDPDESVRIQTMSANGTMFYDYDQGGLLQVASLDSVNQQYLQRCIEGMEIYTGSETQQQSVTMKAYLGAANVPAYRGLRYIVFNDFPLIVSNNSVPNIVVEWRPNDESLVNVADEMERLISHVNLRSESSPVFAAPVIDGIDDLCYGLTVTDQGSLIDHFTKHRNIYNFQIKEADPIKIMRREVGSSLVIDVEVEEADLLSDGNAPALVTNRANPTDFPVGFNLTYNDPDQNYDNKLAPALFDGSQPGRSSSTSSAILTAQSDYIVDKTTARSLAYSAMFNLRSYASMATLDMNDLRPEIGDVVAVTTAEGDLYVLLVENQTITKNRSNAIQAKQLLTAAGADVTGDSGNSPGTINRKFWPEDVLGWDFIADPTAGIDRVWSIRDVSNKYLIGMNNLSAPLRKLSVLLWRDMAANDAAMIEWGGDASTFIAAGPMFEDSFYVYWMPGHTLIVTRLLKSADNIAGVETLVFPPGFSTSGAGNNNGVDGNNAYAFRDGKLYIAWNGKWNGSGSDTTVFKLIVVDVAAWDDTAVTAFDYYVPGSDTPFPYAVEVTDNGTVVIATRVGTGGRYYHANISDLTTWSHLDASFALRKYCSVQHGNKVFFAEDDGSGAKGETNRKTNIAVIEADISGFFETVVDLAFNDPNYLCHSQAALKIMWRSDTHLFIAGNNSNGLGGSTLFAGPPFEHPYLGRFALDTLDAAGGKYLSEFVYNEHDYVIQAGRVFNGKVYLSMDATNASRHAFLSMEEDLTSPTIYWTNETSAPIGDDFADRSLLPVGTSHSNNLCYGSTEENEPVPPYATTGDFIFAYNNGHSVWYEFIAPASDDYTISVTSTGPSLPMGISVYTGSSLASLIDVDSAVAPSTGTTNSLTFSATGGTSYKIAIRKDTARDGAGGALVVRNTANEGKFTISIAGPTAGSPPGAPSITALRPFSAGSSNWDIGAGATTKSNHISIIGTATASASIDVYLDGSGTPAATTTADGSGNWECDIDALSDASHFVNAKQTSGGVTSAASSSHSFTVAADITGFTNHVDGIFLIDGFQFQVQATGSAGSAGPSYSVQSADSHSFRLETRSGDKYYGTDTGHSVDRNELSAGGTDTRGLNNRVFRGTFEVMFESGATSTATDWCIYYQIHGEAGGVSPPFSMQLCGAGGHFTAGDHLLFTSQYWTPAAGALTNANCTTVDHYVSPSPVVRGVFHKIDVEFYPDNTGSGHIYVWLDGVQVVNYTGNVGYGGPPGNAFYYPSIDGVYRGPTPISDTQAVQFRNVLHEIHLT